jgi:hypothetical protein
MDFHVAASQPQPPPFLTPCAGCGWACLFSYQSTRFKQTVVMLCRAVFTRVVEDESGPLHYDDPAAVAIAGLVAIAPYNGPMLSSFLEAGGVSALVQMLNRTTCPLRIQYTLLLVEMLLSDDGTIGSNDRRRTLADLFRKAGGLHYPACHNPREI